MAIITKDTRDRLYNIFNAMTAVSDTVFTVQPRLTSKAADYEGYIIRIRLVNGVESWQAVKTNRDDLQTWQIELFSKKTGLGLSANVEDAIYDYLDLISNTLQSNPYLYLNGNPLAFLDDVRPPSYRITWFGDKTLDGESRTSLTIQFQTKVLRQC